MYLPASSFGVALTVVLSGCTAVSPVADVEVEVEPELEATLETEPRRDRLSGIVQVVAAETATCALDGAGAVYCWGLFTQGTFEDPAVPLFGIPSTRPVRVEGPTATRLSAYPTGVGMLDTRGSVFAVGRLERGGRDRRAFEGIGGNGVARLFGARTRATPMCWLQEDGVVACRHGERHLVPQGALLSTQAAIKLHF